MSKFCLHEFKEKLTAPGEGGLVTYLNPYTYLHARKNWQVYQAFDQIKLDGILLVFFVRLFLRVNVQRKSFDSTSEAVTVFSASCGNQGGVFIVGSTDEHLDTALAVLKTTHVDMNVLGSNSGYFCDEQERQALIEKIVRLEPGTVVCGMGGLLQEQFLLDLRAAGWQGQGYTCGGYIHQLAMFGYDYYPLWADRLNLRWLYRIYKEPNVRQRYFIAYPNFVLKFFKDLILAR